MNRDDIIRMAREAELGTALCHNSIDGDRIWVEGADWHDELERFAALAYEAGAAAERKSMREEIHSCHANCDHPVCVAVRNEREECAKVAENYPNWNELKVNIAAAIRARGQE